MKPSMLVIDHIFHVKTKSFDFLFDLLKADFDIVVHYIDPQAPFSIEPDLLDHEYILICQLDFVTPFFIANQKKVVVIQMYDGSAGLPDIHWIYNRQASYINFSMQLHLRALKNGCRSTFLRYFPDVTKTKLVDDFSTRRAFFWERLPRSFINVANVAVLIDGEVDSIHVHQSSDDGSASSSNLSVLFRSPVTTSKWFEDRSSLEAVLDSCNIFVAPRIAEGIGHAFLEAMAKGMIVIAYDMPTHNEYIDNWVNGILFDTSSTRINLSAWDHFAADMGQAARSSMRLGHDKWLVQATELADYVRRTPRSVTPEHPLLHRFAREAMADYQEGVDSYFCRLNDNPFPVQIASNWSTLYLQTSERPNVERRMNDGLNFVFGDSLHDNYLERGWSEPETGHVWAVEVASSVTLKGADFVGRNLKLVVEALALTNKKLRVSSAGQDIGCATIGRIRKYYLFAEPLQLDSSQTIKLLFEVDALDDAAPDPRPFAFMLRSIRLVPGDVDIDGERTVIVDAVVKPDAVEHYREAPTP